MMKVVTKEMMNIMCGSSSVPSRRRISGSAEFWPAAENPPKKYGRRKRRRNLESRSAAETIRLNLA